MATTACRETVTIPLTAEELEALMKPLSEHRSHWGGRQHLLDRLQGGVRPVREGEWDEWALTASASDLRAAVRYANDERVGGSYGRRLRVLLPKVVAALAALEGR